MIGKRDDCCHDATEPAVNRALVFVVAVAAIFPLSEAELPSWTARQRSKIPGAEVNLPALGCSFDHFICEREKLRQNLDFERFGGREINDQLILGRQLDRQVARLLALRMRPTYSPARR